MKNIPSHLYLNKQKNHKFLQKNEKKKNPCNIINSPQISLFLLLLFYYIIVDVCNKCHDIIE